MIFELGAFRTNALHSAVRLPSHLAYAKETAPAASIRRALSPSNLDLPDAGKAMEAVYEAATLTNPPLRLPLGKDTLAMVRNRQERTSCVLNEYSGWSEVWAGRGKKRPGGS